MISKFVTLMLLAVLALPVPAMGGYRSSNYRIRTKTVEFRDSIKVIGIPVTETGVEYYFQRNITGGISDEDAQKIAKAVIDEMEKRLGTLPAPEPDVSEVEQKVFEIVKNKCAGCHKPDQPDGDLSFITDGRLDLHDNREKWSKAEIAGAMEDEVFDQRMPKGKPPLTDEEIEVFREFESLLLKQERE